MIAASIPLTPAKILRGGGRWKSEVQALSFRGLRSSQSRLRSDETWGFPRAILRNKASSDLPLQKLFDYAAGKVSFL